MPFHNRTKWDSKRHFPVVTSNLPLSDSAVTAENTCNYPVFTLFQVLWFRIGPPYFESIAHDLLRSLQTNRPKTMKTIVLLRHGESIWNRENRFTGWTDVDLSEKGIQEAYRAGETLQKEGFAFEIAFTSYLKRAVKTLNAVLDRCDREWIPVEKSWRLNEKHYGALQGLNKSETAARYGEKQVLLWRRSFDVAPEPLTEEDPRNPRFDPRYAEVPDRELPRTESLKETIARLMPYWTEKIFPALQRVDQILVVAHGNSLRGIVKKLKGLSDEAIVTLNLPTALPYVFEFDRHLQLQRDYFLGDPEEVKKQMEAVAAQGRQKA